MRRTPARWWLRLWPKCPPGAAASAARRCRTPSLRTASWSRKPPAASWGSSLISTSCRKTAQHLLEQCLAGKAPDHLPLQLLEDSCASALFGTWVEGLADRFEPRLCDIYARLFAQAVAHLDRSLQPDTLIERYGRVRR